MSLEYTALVGDCRSIPLPDESVDAVVTDPPYGLLFMGREWDHDVPGPDYWREVKRVMKPGAHLLAFGGTRTWHWLTVGIEEAAFEVRDCLSWMYGTGFPKSDALLKPAWEPVVMAWKDGGDGVVPLNIDGCRIGIGGQWSWDEPRDMGYHGGTDTGAGYAGADSGRWPANVTLSHTRWCRRVGTKRVEGTKPPGPNGQRESPSPVYGDKWGDHESPTYEGADGTEEVEDWDCPPSCAVRKLDEMSGDVGGKWGRQGSEGATSRYWGTEAQAETSDQYVGDTEGGASRFYYCAKASRGEREAGLPDVDGRANRHPTVKPIDLCRWLVRLVTRPGHLVLDPFMGSGSIGCAALQERRRYVGLDLEREYVEIARARLEHWRPKQVDMFKDGASA